MLNRRLEMPSVGGDDSSRPELAAAAAAASPPPPIMLSCNTPTPFCLAECDCVTCTCDREEGRQKVTINARLCGNRRTQLRRRKQKKAEEREGGWGRPSIARFKNQGPAYRSFLGRVLRPGTATSWSPVSRKEYI